MDLLILSQWLTTGFMTGLIWFVQIVVNLLSQALRQASPQPLCIEAWCVARTLPPQSKLHLY